MEIDWKSALIVIVLLPLIWFGCKTEEVLATEKSFITDGFFNGGFTHGIPSLEEAGIPRELQFFFLVEDKTPLDHVCNDSSTFTMNYNGVFAREINQKLFLIKEGDVIRTQRVPHPFIIRTYTKTFRCSDLKVQNEKTFLPGEIVVNKGARFRIFGATDKIYIGEEVIHDPSIDEGGGSGNSNFEILFPKEGDKIAGYTTPGGGSLLKWYDIKVRGKFIYNPEWYELDKMIQTGIINSTIVRMGEETRGMGNGVGLKGGNSGFKWIKAPGEDKETNEVEFEMTMQSIMFKGTCDLTVGVSVPQNDATKQEVIELYSAIERGVQPLADSYLYISNVVKNITFTQDNQSGDYVPPDEDNGESNGNVDGSIGGGDLPTKPEGGGILEWLQYFIDLFIYVITLPFKIIYDVSNAVISIITDVVKNMINYVGLIGQMFTFLPNELQVILKGVFAVGGISAIFGYIRR